MPDTQLLDLTIALDRMSDGYVVLDLDWRVRFVNAAAARLLQRDAADLLGQNVWDEFPLAVGSVFDDHYREALRTQREVVFDGYVAELDTWFAIHVHPSPDDVTLVLRDVTHLHELVAERRTLLDGLLGAEDQERARIAANVHDESLQALGALRLGLEVLRGHLPAPPVTVDAQLTSLADQVGAATEQLRSLLFSLEPTVSVSPISVGIRMQAATIFDGSSTHWSVDDLDAGEELAGAERSQVLRITKEALLNVRAHAGAREVTVTIRGDGAGQEVVIADDGIGPDPASFTSAAGHRGLATMRDRAAVLGGSCSVEATTPVGCTVRVHVPRVPPVVDRQVHRVGLGSPFGGERS